MKITLLIILSIYLVMIGLLYLSQRSLLYFPSPAYDHDLDVFQIENEGERINVLVLNPNRSNAIIYFGGNAEPVIFNAEPFAHHLTEFTIYLVEYRGYGDSSGSPTEAGLFSDALAVYDSIKPKHQQISVMGRSLGSGVATYLASQRSVHKLALITPFDSIANVAKKKMPIFPVGLLLKDRYDSAGRASMVSAEVFIAIAELDQIVPKEHAFELAAAFKDDQVETQVLSGADHNNISVHPEFFPALVGFLR